MNVYVYSETGSFMFTKTGTLVGYTSNTVTVQQGGTTYVYGEQGAVRVLKINMMKEYSRPFKNNGSGVFRKCVIDYCLSPKVMPIHFFKEDVEQLVDDQNLTAIFEKGNSLQEMTEGIGSCRDRFSR